MQPSETQSARFVVPPGQETLIARMLNPPEIGGGWRLVRASIEKDAIEGYYEGEGEAQARVVLKAREDAPAEWERTDRFAFGVATADTSVAIAALLYRDVLAAVRESESKFEWREVGSDMRPATDDGDSVERAERDPDRDRAAEAEIDLHLDHTPFIDLGLDFDYAGALAEAMALLDRFVPYQSDPTYGITGWRGLALQALDGDPTHVATTDEDAGAYREESRYQLTEIAVRCPITMSLLEEILDLDNSRTVSFLLVEPGAAITVHVDGDGPPVIRSLNIALNMPEGCRLVIDANPDGSDNAYTRTAPFRAGTALVLNVAKYHYVVNDSPEPRIHIVARGALKIPASDVLVRAETQDGMRGVEAVEAALLVKRRALGAAAAEAPVPRLSAGAPGLSPFVRTLADRACERLLALLGFGDHAVSAAVGPAAGAPEEWRAAVEVRLPSTAVVTLEFQSTNAARPAWFRSAHLACSYRAGEVDPFADPRDRAFLDEMCRRLDQVDPTSADAVSPSVTALLDALQQYRPFTAVKDEDYRIIYRGAGVATGILWFGFECNQDCRMCWQGRGWPSPPDEVFDRWLDELCAAGVGSLIFSGGEPTLKPRLVQWLERAAQAGIPVTLETNAIALREPDYLASLCAAGVDTVVVSLHAASAAVSDALTMAPGTFDLTIEGTQAALAAGVQVGIHCVVESANVSTLEEHAKLVSELGTVGRRISHVSYSFPIAYHRRELYDGAIVPLDELRPRLSAAVRIHRGAGTEVRFLGTSGFTPCAYDDPESLLPSLPEVVTEEMRADRTFVAACDACSVRPRCLGVHGAYAEAHGERGVEAIA